MKCTNIFVLPPKVMPAYWRTLSYERAVAVSSFGKTFHMTGWKIGYCVAPAAISAEIRKVHQYLTFCVNTPAQLALADMLRAAPEHYRALPDFYRKNAMCWLTRWRKAD